MSANICRDTFVIAIIADLDCHLEITSDSTLQFDLEPINEQSLRFDFEYYLGTGFDTSHANFGFSAELDALSTPNAASMSFSDGVFNPPSPDTTQGPRTLHTGYLTYVATANDLIDSMAADQNIGGTITLNTGVTP